MADEMAFRLMLLGLAKPIPETAGPVSRIVPVPRSAPPSMPMKALIRMAVRRVETLVESQFGQCNDMVEDSVVGMSLR